MRKFGIALITAILSLLSTEEVPKRHITVHHIIGKKMGGRNPI